MQFILVHVIGLKNKNEESILNARYYVCMHALSLVSHIYVAVHEEIAVDNTSQGHSF
jgi:hypothetical protein